MSSGRIIQSQPFFLRTEGARGADGTAMHIDGCAQIDHVWVWGGGCAPREVLSGETVLSWTTMEASSECALARSRPRGPGAVARRVALVWHGVVSC